MKLNTEQEKAIELIMQNAHLLSTVSVGHDTNKTVLPIMATNQLKIKEV